MNSVEAIMLKNRTDPHVAEMLNYPLFRTRGPNQRQNCWEISDNMAMLDTVLRGFHCGPIYIIQDIDNNVDDVFDGAHRCESIFSFIDNKYPVTKSKNDTINWESSPLKDYQGKFFKDLQPGIQQALKQYKFYINVIDPDTASDPSSLALLWERLSKAGKPLNKYETKHPTHSLLYDLLKKNINEYKWLSTPFFPQDKSKRGQLESKLMKLLALSEKEVIPSFASMEDLVEKWCDEVLGKTTEEIKKNSEEKADLFTNRLKCIRSLMKELVDRNVLHDKEICIVDKSREVPFLLILGRIGYWFPTVSQFKRVSEEVCEKISEILKMKPTELCDYLTSNSRNATFQRKLLDNLDSTFKPLSDKANERRCFTVGEKKKKLEEQGGLCTECNQPILEYQRNAGDHIVEFCRGGTTSYENLQILHKHCHELKNM